MKKRGFSIHNISRVLTIEESLKRQEEYEKFLEQSDGTPEDIEKHKKMFEVLKKMELV